ncbi:uncharacterized protein LOC111613368 [Centruroides sculpturatus]|uniref:uncharacterized protein LOC111613368 n=1 Tax=Centruroides sculpturatus TaxID=218467 RepID=UPI000C6DE7ED|nr:uncharacterized protein LOC111613368 [Centruroides sculpturatus]
MPLRRNRRQYEQLTEFERGRIVGLREAGWSNRHIGRHLCRSDMVVARCWQQWMTEGRVYHRRGSGRPRNTNEREDRAIRRAATSTPTMSLSSIQRHLPPSRHTVASRETIRRRLADAGIRSRRPLRRLPLTPHHRQCRLDFCRSRASWSVTDWRRVVFSDESRFSLSADDHRTRVWRLSLDLIMCLLIKEMEKEKQLDNLISEEFYQIEEDYCKSSLEATRTMKIHEYFKTLRDTEPELNIELQGIKTEVNSLKQENKYFQGELTKLFQKIEKMEEISKNHSQIKSMLEFEIDKLKIQLVDMLVYVWMHVTFVKWIAEAAKFGTVGILVNTSFSLRLARMKDK